MTRWEQLLGGYATGNLSGEEREFLMREALRNQALFDALMDEEALREVLADPATRAELLRALAPDGKQAAWWRGRWTWSAVGAVAAGLALWVVMRPLDTGRRLEMAENRAPAPQAPAAPAMAATKPEPVASEIQTPKRLKLSQPLKDAVVFPMAAPETKARAETDQAGPVEVAAAAPPPPPRAAARQMVADAAAEPSLAKKEKQAAAPEALAIAFQDAEGAWREIEADTVLPANRPLRLRLTSRRAGVLSVLPRFAEPRVVAAGVAAEVLLPAQEAGTLQLSFTVGAVNAVGALGATSDFRENRARPLSTGGAASAIAPPPPLVRGIRLRIE